MGLPVPLAYLIASERRARRAFQWRLVWQARGCRRPAAQPPRPTKGNSGGEEANCGAWEFEGGPVKLEQFASAW